MKTMEATSVIGTCPPLRVEIMRPERSLTSLKRPSGYMTLTAYSWSLVCRSAALMPEIMFFAVERMADGVVPIAAAWTGSTMISARGLPSLRLVEAESMPSNPATTVLISSATSRSVSRLEPVRLICTPRLPKDIELRSSTSTDALSMPEVCSRMRVMKSPVEIPRSSLR